MNNKKLLSTMPLLLYVWVSSGEGFQCLPTHISAENRSACKYHFIVTPAEATSLLTG